MNPQKTYMMEFAVRGKKVDKVLNNPQKVAIYS